MRELAQSLRPRIRALAQATERGPEFREGVRKLRQENSRRIFSILDSEQQVKYSNMINAQRSNPELPGTVWILENGTPKLLNVTIGVGDGNSTELIGGGIKEGQEVIVGIKRS